MKLTCVNIIEARKIEFYKATQEKVVKEKAMIRYILRFYKDSTFFVKTERNVTLDMLIVPIAERFCILELSAND